MVVVVVVSWFVTYVLTGEILSLSPLLACVWFLLGGSVFYAGYK